MSRLAQEVTDPLGFWERVEAQNAADARRYRYLRDHMLHGVAHPHGEAIGMTDVIYGDDADTAIDRAIKAQEGKS